MKIKVIVQYRPREDADETERFFMRQVLTESELYDAPQGDTYFLRLDKRQIQYLIDVDVYESLTFMLLSDRYPAAIYYFYREHVDAIFNTYDVSYDRKRMSEEQIAKLNKRHDLGLIYRAGTYREHIKNASALTVLELISAEESVFKGDVSDLNGNISELYLIHNI